MSYQSVNFSERLARAGLTRDGWRIVGGLVWRATLLGTAFCLVLGPDQGVNLRLNLLSYIIALVWSYYDGLFVKRWWRYAWIEAIFLHFAGVQVGNLLTSILGSPVIST